jgi:hypothetical protein
MIMIALCSCFLGGMLATRFKVLVLLPAVALGVLLVIITASVREANLSSALSAAAVLAIALQLGYLGGLLTRLFVAAGRPPFHRTIRSTTAQG